MNQDEYLTFSNNSEEEWEKAEKEPKILFKFKSIEQVIDLERLCNGLKNNNLYFPTIEQLNDSLEGRGTKIFMSDCFVYESKLADKYQVLSFSANCFSPVLWSHYGNNRKGICLGFYKGNPLDENNNSALKFAKKVDYVDRRDTFSCDESSAILYDLMHKMKEWEYEQEWRIIREPNNSLPDPKMFSYNKEDLACIILGEKMCDRVKEIIKTVITDIPIYCMDYDASKYSLILKRGKNTIYSIDELLCDLKN